MDSVRTMRLKLCIHTRSKASGLVAQLDRVLASEARGRGFESRRDRSEDRRSSNGRGGFLLRIRPVAAQRVSTFHLTRDVLGLQVRPLFDPSKELLVIVGVPKEIKTREYRVGMTPAIAKAYVTAGHTVFIEKGAGEGAGITDGEYERVGAKIVNSPDELREQAAASAQKARTRNLMRAIYHCASYKRAVPMSPRSTLAHARKVLQVESRAVVRGPSRAACT